MCLRCDGKLHTTFERSLLKVFSKVFWKTPWVAAVTPMVVLIIPDDINPRRIPATPHATLDCDAKVMVILGMRIKRNDDRTSADRKRPVLRASLISCGMLELKLKLPVNI